MENFINEYCWMKGDPELTFLAIAGVFYIIRWNYYLHLPFEIVAKNSFEKM